MGDGKKCNEDTQEKHVFKSFGYRRLPFIRLDMCSSLNVIDSFKLR